MHTILRNLNLLDSAGRLSITNLAVVILLIKLAMSPSNLADAGALFVTLLNYGHKRKVTAETSNSELNTRMSQIETRVSEAESSVASAMLKIGLK